MITKTERATIETFTKRAIERATSPKRYAGKQGFPLLLLFYRNQDGELGKVKAAPLPGDMPLWFLLQRHYAKVRTIAAAVLILADGYSIAV